MGGKSENKMIAEAIFRGHSGWESDLALDSGAADSFRSWTGIKPIQVSDAAGVRGVRKGTEAGRGNPLADVARPNMYRGGFAFLSIKGADPYPSKAVITTGGGMSALRNVADFGCSCPVVFLAIFGSGRVGVKVADLASIVRDHGIAEENPNGWGKGKAPPLYLTTTTRPSGVKSAAAMLAAGAFTAEQAEEFSTKTYQRIELSFAALGWSRGRGWIEVEGQNGEPNGSAIRQIVEDGLDWSALIFNSDDANPSDLIIG